jgi:hypothetical protein
MVVCGFVPPLEVAAAAKWGLCVARIISSGLNLMPAAGMTMFRSALSASASRLGRVETLIKRVTAPPKRIGTVKAYGRTFRHARRGWR